MYKIGAHQSVAGGHKNALISIYEKGGNCLQIFSSSPRVWNSATITDEQITEFVELKQKLGIDPIYFHAMYLLNLADSGEAGKRSVQTIVKDLTLAEKMHIQGIVVHLGSFRENKSVETFNTLIENIQTVLHNTPSSTFFMIENAGSRKIGTQLDEIATIIKAVHDPRLKVCLDTCHLHAAGYEFSTPEMLATFLEEVEQTIGISRVEMFHANDSKGALGAYLDRHENIGKGTLGEAPFQLLLTHEKTKHIPFILEVPGLDDKGPDKANIDVLKRLTGT
ncbi:deoxyribonuclease IV [soil metagenome]